MSIKITGVGKRFGDFVALSDIDLDIPTGELTALLGPSGGGKSTLLRIIAGLELSDTGTVEIEGRDATRLPAQKRNVGFVFQHYAAFRHLSVAGNVGFGLKIRKRPKAEIAAKVEELLALVHLSQFADRLPSQLSGGQRQRMALARALAIESIRGAAGRAVRCAGRQVRKELRAWLRRLHDEVHVTTVVVTHDQDKAREVQGCLGPVAGGVDDHHDVGGHAPRGSRAVVGGLTGSGASRSPQASAIRTAFTRSFTSSLR
jgi:sulfate/thiosulfate transport system ATP-binding protein